MNFNFAKTILLLFFTLFVNSVGQNEFTSSQSNNHADLIFVKYESFLKNHPVYTNMINQYKLNNVIIIEKTFNDAKNDIRVLTMLEVPIGHIKIHHHFKESSYNGSLFSTIVSSLGVCLAIFVLPAALFVGALCDDTSSAILLICGGILFFTILISNFVWSEYAVDNFKYDFLTSSQIRDIVMR